jgi:ketosteroid isomerase-like protein
MKQAMMAIALAGVLGGIVAAQSGGGARDEVSAAAKHFGDTHLTCDPKEMARIATDDILWMHPDGTLEKGKDTFVKSHGNPPNANCKFDEWKINVDSINVYGDAAVVLGVLHYQVKAAKGDLGIIQTYVKRNGRWLLAASMANNAVPKGHTPN